MNLDRFIRLFLSWSGLYVFLDEFQGIRSTGQNPAAT